MGAEKRICCSIMLCQMTAILSGVAIMYLSVIVVIPSKKELDFDFINDPVMCTTTKADDIAAGGKKVKCEWSTCHEWCLSKASSPCMQIYAMPRKKGSDVEFQNCDILYEENCSAFNVSRTTERLCKKGECKDMIGLYNCSKEEKNACRELTPAYRCPGKVDKQTITCTADKCSKRLDGVYTCLDPGKCNKIKGLANYTDCERKCEHLNFTGGNTLIFSSHNLVYARCGEVNSTGNNTIMDLNNEGNWKNTRKALTIFCTYLEKEEGKKDVMINMQDCFNASLHNDADLRSIKTYLKLIDFRDRIPTNTKWYIAPEESLRILNDTVLLVNSQGCVNSLIKECTAFFDTHATDGKDGKTPSRYPCFYTDSMSDFVVGKFNPEYTYLMMMVTSVLPGTLFVTSCFCLFFCSKSIGADEHGHLKVTLLSSKNKGGTPGGSVMDL